MVRCYTQNIDGLETRVGLSTDLARGKGNGKRFTIKALQTPGDESTVLKGSIRDGGCEVVQLHGDLVSLRCLNNCASTCTWQEYHNKEFLRGGAPECPSCAETNSDRLRRGKRTTKVGSLRPNVVLYGEQNPSENELSSIIQHDLRLAPDLILILGTSLKVHGLKVLVKEFAKAAHGGKKPGKVVFVNHTAPSPSAWDGIIDYWVQIDCDLWVQGLKERVPDMFKKQQELSPKYMTSLGPARSPNLFSQQKTKSVKQGSIENTTCSKYFQRESSPSAQRAQRLGDSPTKRKPLANLSLTANIPISSPSKMDTGFETPHKNSQLPTPPTSKRAHAPKALNPRKREASIIAPATLDDIPPSLFNSILDNIPPLSPFKFQFVKRARESTVKDGVIEGTFHLPVCRSPDSTSRKRSAHWMRPTDPRDLHQLYPSKRRKVVHEFAVFEDSGADEDSTLEREKHVTKTATPESKPLSTPTSLRVVIEMKAMSSSIDAEEAIPQTPTPKGTTTAIRPSENVYTVPETPTRTSRPTPKLPLPSSAAQRTRSSPRKKKVLLVSTKQEGRERTGLLGGKFETFWKKRPRDGAMRFEFDEKGIPKWIANGVV